MKKILIVDDEPSIVTLLKYNIEQAGFQTEVAFDGVMAVEQAGKDAYHLIVLDLMLPKMNGMEVCTYLRQKNVDTPILMLTAKDDELDKITGLESGADDYLTKPFSPKEVVARIRAILRRTAKENDSFYSFIKVGDLAVFPERHEAEMDQETLILTRKEFELLHYLATHQGKIVTRDQLLSAVWQYDFVGDTRIVDVHVSHLREKIELDSKQPIYIKTVRGLGYKLEEPY